MLSLEMIEPITMFKHFTEDEKKEFVRLGHEVHSCQAGDAIIVEGEHEKSLYLLLAGTCSVSKTEDNHKIRLAKLSTGDQLVGQPLIVGRAHVLGRRQHVKALEAPIQRRAERIDHQREQTHQPRRYE